MITVTVNIPPDPSNEATTIEVQGVKGPSCMNLTKALDDVLGDRNVEYTKEYHQRAEAKNQLRSGVGQ